MLCGEVCLIVSTEAGSSRALFGELTEEARGGEGYLHELQKQRSQSLLDVL